MADLAAINANIVELQAKNTSMADSIQLLTTQTSQMSAQITDLNKKLDINAQLADNIAQTFPKLAAQLDDMRAKIKNEVEETCQRIERNDETIKLNHVRLNEITNKMTEMETHIQNLVRDIIDQFRNHRPQQPDNPLLNSSQPIKMRIADSSSSIPAPHEKAICQLFNPNEEFFIEDDDQPVEFLPAANKEN